MAIRNGNFRGGSIKSLSFLMYLDFSNSTNGLKKRQMPG